MTGSLMQSDKPKRRATYDVLVVGAGFAGAIAARELARQRRSVILLEARDRLGGRTWRKGDALGGLSLEMGGTWIDPRQHLSWAEAKRYRIAVGTPALGAPPNLWLVGGELRKSQLPVPIDELGDIERVIRALGQAASRIDPGTPLHDQDVADLDISLDEFLDGLNLGPDTREIASVYIGAYGSGYGKDISTLHLARRIAAAGSFVEFVLSGASHPLLEGTSGLIEAIVSDSGASVVLNASIHRIEQDTRGVTAVSDAQEYRAMVGVITVPANVLKHIAFDPALSKEKRELSHEELACTGLKIWVLTKRVPEDFSACGRGRGLDMLWSERGAGDGCVVMVGYGPDADRLDLNDEIAVERAVHAFIPEAEVVASTGHDWRHDPYALETWAVFRPGQITRYESHLRRREGRLVFGGSHTALRWPGFIDGAIESGFRAAGEAEALLLNRSQK